MVLILRLWTQDSKVLTSPAKSHTTSGLNGTKFTNETRHTLPFAMWTHEQCTRFAMFEAVGNRGRSCSLRLAPVQRSQLDENSTTILLQIEMICNSENPECTERPRIKFNCTNWYDHFWIIFYNCSNGCPIWLIWLACTLQLSHFYAPRRDCWQSLDSGGNSIRNNSQPFSTSRSR